MNLFALHLTPAAHHLVFHRPGHSDLSTQRPTEFIPQICSNESAPLHSSTSCSFFSFVTFSQWSKHKVRLQNRRKPAPLVNFLWESLGLGEILKTIFLKYRVNDQRSWAGKLAVVAGSFSHKLMSSSWVWVSFYLRIWKAHFLRIALSLSIVWIAQVEGTFIVLCGTFFAESSVWRNPLNHFWLLNISFY